jgi:two-component system capsular synthesis sensor histidine kinase RcsC
VQQASTGLGLPIARKLARMMGGDVRLEPNPLQHGTCFVFELPFVTLTATGSAKSDDTESLPSVGSGPQSDPARSSKPRLVSGADADADKVGARSAARAAAPTAAAAPVAPPAPPVAPPAPKKPLAGLRIAAAEDEPATHMILKRMLEKGGVDEVKMFFEGSELSRQYRANPALFDHFDIILIDMHMMYNDGLTTLRLLREAGCTMPCIAVTGAASEEEAAAYIAGGFATVCVKPYTAEQLFGHVLGVLRARQKKRDRHSDKGKVDSDKDKVDAATDASFALDP